MNHKLFKIILNFSAVIVLLILLLAPMYFARNFSQVAGVKSNSPYLLVSQVEKFPNMEFLQRSDKYQLRFIKQGDSQAYLGVLILNNPTQETKKYGLKITSGIANVFFGEDLGTKSVTMSIPASASIPISILSPHEASAQSQIVEFRIQAE